MQKTKHNHLTVQHNTGQRRGWDEMRKLLILICLGVLLVGCANRSVKYDCRSQAIEYCRANRSEYNQFNNCVWEKYIKCLDVNGLLFD